MRSSFTLADESTQPSHMQVGKEGEEKASKYLEGLGYEIRGRNVRMGRDEIDIIAFDPADKVLVFVEVKSRLLQDAEYPARMSAGFYKIARVKRAAHRWVSEHEFDDPYRFDLVCVEGKKVTEHYKEIGYF